MFKRILVPLDESARAERAIPVALRLAQATHGVVILLRVVDPITELWPVPPERWSMTYTIEAHIAEAKQYLVRLTGTISSEAISVETEVALGPPAQAILSAVSTYQADMIVLCSHGYTGLKRWIMGSVAEKVAHAASVPVLMLRQGGSFPAGLHPDVLQPLRVLVPLDGSTPAKTALLPAISLISALVGSAAPAALHILKVMPPVPTDEKKDPFLAQKRLLQRSMKYLSAVSHLLHQDMQKQRASDQDPTITWSVETSTDVAGAIVHVAENGTDVGGIGTIGRSDVIAMATHGYSGMYHWTMGSVTERVLHATTLPLFIVRPTQITNKEHSDWLATTMATLEH